MITLALELISVRRQKDGHAVPRITAFADYQRSAEYEPCLDPCEKHEEVDGSQVRHY